VPNILFHLEDFLEFGIREVHLSFGGVDFIRDRVALQFGKIEMAGFPIEEANITALDGLGFISRGFLITSSFGSGESSGIHITSGSGSFLGIPALEASGEIGGFHA